MRFSSLLGAVLAGFMLVTSTAVAQRHRPPHGPQTPPETPPATPDTPSAGQTATTSQDQEARMLFEAGRVAYTAGRFEDSLDYFQRAHSMSGRAVLLYNVGSAADKLRRDAVALDAFRRYLEAMPTAENRAEVESRIHVLEQVVASAQPTVTVPTVTVPPVTDPTVTVPPPAGGETAHEAALDASLHVGGDGGDAQRDSGGSIFREWWFWTVVGVVVVGSTVGIVAAASSGGGLGPLQKGDDGSVYMTLGAL